MNKIDNINTTLKINNKKIQKGYIEIGYSTTIEEYMITYQGYGNHNNDTINWKEIFNHGKQDRDFTIETGTVNLYMDHSKAKKISTFKNLNNIEIFQQPAEDGYEVTIYMSELVKEETIDITDSRTMKMQLRKLDMKKNEIIKKIRKRKE
jgi:hypothetical protein